MAKDDKKEKPAKDAKPGKEKKAGKKGGGLLFLILLAAGGVMALPLTLVVIAGLIPTIVIALTDRNPKKNLTVAVGTLNLASTLYVALLLFKKGFTLQYSFQLLSEPVNYAIMWGGAALGLALCKIIPPAVAQLLAGLAEIKILKYRENQKELKKNWGDQVGS